MTPKGSNKILWHQTNSTRQLRVAQGKSSHK